MEYKVGDKVKIKTWETMKKEFGLHIADVINSSCYFTYTMENEIVQLDSERIVTISMVRDKDCYLCKELHSWCLSDDMFAKTIESKEDTILTNRFELMDFE